MDEPETDPEPQAGALRRGWTTGACATAAARSAASALICGQFEDPVTITLPGGQRPAFALAHEAVGEDWAEAGIVKDAGDDPDVTHGATIIARAARGALGSGVGFAAGPGVGTITRPGLPLAVGEPAINPVPRQMMRQEITALCAAHGMPADVVIRISVPGGEELAKKTWNPRLGIIGGLSILGTTGIVIPYSCSAWIHSIQRGIDVARAMGLDHVVGATGHTSEVAARELLGLPEQAFLDMGDFAGGLLKYLRAHPVARVTVAGGFAKMTKLAQGALDLHSARSKIDREWLAQRLARLGAGADLVARAEAANTAAEILQLAAAAELPLADAVADAACATVRQVIRDSGIAAGVLVIDRGGRVVGSAGLGG